MIIKTIEDVIKAKKFVNDSIKKLDRLYQECDKHKTHKGPIKIFNKPVRFELCLYCYRPTNYEEIAEWVLNKRENIRDILNNFNYSYLKLHIENEIEQQKSRYRYYGLRVLESGLGFINPPPISYE